MTNKIRVALAIITNENGELLAARKKNATYFTLPGGKINVKEDPIQALLRELEEELNIKFSNSDFQLTGTHQTRAANEANTTVKGYIFRLLKPINLKIRPYSEIEEVIWLSKSTYKNYKLAHLLSEFALPKWLNSELP